jgi:mannose/fructose-specific phosphotransferase system component IIA
MDWRRYELEQLIKLHGQQAQQLVETARMFTGDKDAEDLDFVRQCVEFARWRTERQTELRRQLAELTSRPKAQAE